MMFLHILPPMKHIVVFTRFVLKFCNLSVSTPFERIVHELQCTYTEWRFEDSDSEFLTVVHQLVDFHVTRKVLVLVDEVDYLRRILVRT